MNVRYFFRNIFIPNKFSIHLKCIHIDVVENLNKISYIIDLIVFNLGKCEYEITVCKHFSHTASLREFKFVSLVKWFSSWSLGSWNSMIWELTL